MGFLFGKKPAVTSMAEVLEDGAPKMMEWSRLQMEKSKQRFQKSEEYARAPMFQVRVHVTPQGAAPFDAQMDTSLAAIGLMKPGIQVQVSYDPKQSERVSLVDDVNAVLARNLQLAAKPNPAEKPVALCAHCGKYYEGSPKFCPNCGHALP